VTSASRTPQTEWKLDEAKFFLWHLRDSRPTLASRDAPAFSFYLSAFLNAAYSCREVLRLEVLQGKLMWRDAFYRWREAWVGSLDNADRRACTLGLGERNSEVHERGAKTVPKSGLVAMKPQSLFRGGIYGNIVTGGSPIPAGPLLDEETASAVGWGSYRWVSRRSALRRRERPARSDRDVRAVSRAIAPVRR
jgi:hypothetical protein